MKFNLATDPGAGPAFANVATIVSGNNQSVTRTGSSVPGGTASFTPLTVLVTDLSGRPVPGDRVDWICAAPAQMACQMQPAGGSSASTTTDAQGHAMLNQIGGNSVSTYYATGALKVDVSGPTLKPLAFTLTATDPAPATVAYVSDAKLSIVSGNGQSHDRNGSNVQGGTASFQPLSVKLVNQLGQAIPNAPVTFVCNHSAQTACQFDPSGADRGTYVVNTDANGMATLNRMGGNSLSFYYGSGSFTVSAKYGSVTSIDFSETVR